MLILNSNSKFIYIILGWKISTENIDIFAPIHGGSVSIIFWQTFFKQYYKVLKLQLWLTNDTTWGTIATFTKKRSRFPPWVSSVNFSSSCAIFYCIYYSKFYLFTIFCLFKQTFVGVLWNGYSDKIWKTHWKTLLMDVGRVAGLVLQLY